MLTRRRRTSEGESQLDYNQARNGHRTNGVPHQRALNVGAASGVARYASPARSGPLDADMTCRDRTTEFMSTLKSMQSRMGSSQLSSVYRNHSDLKQRSEFMQIAKRIGRDLSSTFSKLEKLTILAKKKSLFDDRPVEIQELTYIIKQDINSLNKQIASLQELSRSKARIGGQHRQTHSNAVVVALQSKLATMSNNFKSVLEVRTENLKQQRSRREQYSQGPVASSLPPSAMTGHYTGSVLLQEDSTSSQEVAIDMGMGPGSSRYQEQLQLVDEQDSYIQSRATTMESIETTIVELGSIFQQLAHMVQEQEEMVERIDHNVELSEMNVEAAHGEILKYFRSVTSNRWLMIKVFFVLVVFFIVFVVFLA